MIDELFVEAQSRVIMAETMLDVLKAELSDAKKSSIEEKQRLEDLLVVERNARAVLEAKVQILENIPIPVYPDHAPMMNIMLEIKAMMQQCMEPQDPMPKEFDILRGSDGKILKIKVKE